MAFDGIYRPLAERCEIEASDLADLGLNDASVVLYEAEARIRSLETEVADYATALAEARAEGRRQGLEEADDREVERILGLTDTQVTAEIEAEGRDPEALAEAMRGQMNATFRLVEEARSWRAVAERLGQELREVSERAGKAMDGVTVFVTSKERIQRPAGERWWQEEIAAVKDAGALIPLATNTPETQKPETGESDE